MNWTRCYKSVVFEIYIHHKPRYVHFARPLSMTSILMLFLLDLRAWRTYQSRDMLARSPSTSSNMRVTIKSRIINIDLFFLTRNIGSPLQTFVSKIWKMPFAKSNNWTSSQRKQFLLLNFEFLSISMRLCKSCSSSSKQCLLDDAFKKCLACVTLGKPCDLAILPSTMRKVHKERIRVRSEVCEAKAKLQRLKRQLKRLKDEEKNLIIKEWNTINCLKEKKSQNTPNFTFPFDVVSKQFQFPNLNWSPLVIDFISIDLNESREVLIDNS